MGKHKKRRARGPRGPYKPREPSPRLRDILSIVSELASEQGPPSAKAVAQALGVTWGGARKQLQALARRGLIVDAPVEVSAGKWRLTTAGKEALASGAELPGGEADE